MFNLVTDVASYPAFLPWCSHAAVKTQHADGVTAEIGMRISGIRQSFSTRNTHIVPTEGAQPAGTFEIRMALEDGPFSSLRGGWVFAPLGDGAEAACRVVLQMDYGFKSGVLAALVGPVFDHIASNLVDAFVKRAEQVYG